MKTPASGFILLCASQMKGSVCSVMNLMLLRTALIRFGHIPEQAELFLEHLSELCFYFHTTQKEDPFLLKI